GMGERPGVEVLADLADEVAVAVEFQDLRGGGAKRVGDRAAARIDVDVALGIRRHAGGFAEVHVRRQLDEVRDRIELQLRRRRRLRKRRRTEQHQESGEPWSHASLPGDGDGMDVLVVPPLRQYTNGYACNTIGARSATWSGSCSEP